MYNILFVDDEPLVADSMKTILQWDKLFINPPFIAYSAEQAKNIFLHQHIDFMISDIEMLGCDGFGLLAWVKKHDPSTLSVFLTCHARFDFAKQAIDLGAVGYLLKPICETELEEILHKCVKKREWESNQGFQTLPSEQYSKLIADAIAYIRKNIGNTITCESLSRELYIGESQLPRQFSKETGMTLPEFITECRFAKAKELLISTDESITDICTQVGFNYPAYFTKVFRDKTGMTPRQYRDTLSNRNFSK